MGYSRRISKYLKRILLSDLIHMINIVDLEDISVKTLILDNGCFLEKKSLLN